MDFDASKQALINVYLQQMGNLVEVINLLLPHATGASSPLPIDSPLVAEATRLANQVTAIKEISSEKTS
jgi:hypothetical protein